MNLVKKKVFEIVAGDYIDGFGEVLNIRKNNIRTQFDFKLEGKEYFKSFMNNMTLYCSCKQLTLSDNEIELDVESLKNGRIIAKCSCGGKVDCVYEGEVSETYHYFCECGSSLSIDGYSLDSYMEALMENDLMNNIISEIVEMAKEGVKEVLIAYNLKGELSICETYQVDYVDENLQVGTIDLEAYSTYEDIKEELENMLED